MTGISFVPTLPDEARSDPAPREGGGSPWGRIDSVIPQAPGIWFVSTPGHGGIKVTRALNARIPAYMRCTGGWYEEDCDWCIPALVFADTITSTFLRKSIDDGTAKATLLSYRPDAYEKFFGEVVLPGMSYARDQEIFDREHINDWVVICARGDWAKDVPKGMVGVTCTRGGIRQGRSGEEAHFLVPADEYRNHGGRFVADPARHQRVSQSFV